MVKLRQFTIPVYISYLYPYCDDDLFHHLYVDRVDPSIYSYYDVHF